MPGIMLDVGKRYRGQIGFGANAEYVIFEVIDVSGCFVRARKWGHYPVSGCTYYGIAMLNLNQFSSVEEWTADPREDGSGAIPPEERPPKIEQPQRELSRCFACNSTAMHKNCCAVCHKYFCRQHGSIIRNHSGSQTHYWIRCHKHPRKKSLLFGMILRDDSPNGFEAADVIRDDEHDWDEY